MSLGAKQASHDAFNDKFTTCSDTNRTMELDFVKNKQNMKTRKPFRIKYIEKTLCAKWCNT